MSELKKKVCNLQKLLKQPDHPEKYYLKVWAYVLGSGERSPPVGVQSPQSIRGKA